MRPAPQPCAARLGSASLTSTSPRPSARASWTPRGASPDGAGGALGAIGGRRAGGRAGSVRHQRRDTPRLMGDDASAASGPDDGRAQSGSRPSQATPSARGWATRLPASGRHYRFNAPRRSPVLPRFSPAHQPTVEGRRRWVGGILSRMDAATELTRMYLQRVPTIHPRRPSQANAQSRWFGFGFGFGYRAMATEEAEGRRQPSMARLYRPVSGTLHRPWQCGIP